MLEDLMGPRNSRPQRINELLPVAVEPPLPSASAHSGSLSVLAAFASALPSQWRPLLTDAAAQRHTAA